MRAAPSLAERALTVLAAVAAVGAVGVGVWSDPTRGLFGDWEHPDMLSNHWVYGWVADQLAKGGSILHNDAYYAPVGDAPFLAGNASGALLAAPLAWAFGTPLGLNVHLFLVLVLNVLASAALARAAGANPRAALLAGVGFGISPFVLTELSAGRFAQVPVWEMAGGLALWIGALEDRSWRKGVLAGALVGLAGVEYFYYGLFAGGIAALLALFRRPKDARVLAAGAIAAAAVVGPLLVLFARGWTSVVGASEAEATFPHPFSLQASLPWSWPVWTDVPTMVPAHLSWVLLVLAIVDVQAARRTAGLPDRPAGDRLVAPLLVAGVGAWALSLGPYLNTMEGPSYQSHLPYLWIYGLHPALQRFWWPYRHAVVVTLVTAVLAARGLSRLLDRLPPRAGLVALALALLAVPAELRARGAPVVAATSRLADPLPDVVEKLRALPDGQVLDLPLAPELRIAQQHLTLQAMHHHPLLDGHAMWVDRVRPKAWDERVAASSFLAELMRYERGKPIPTDPARVDHFVYDVADIATLRGYGLRWIVVWDEMFASSLSELPDQLRTLLGELFGDPAADGDGLTVYDLAKHQGDGDLPAPRWSFPKGVSTGDGSSRMTDTLPASILVEHGVRR